MKQCYLENVTSFEVTFNEVTSLMATTFLISFRRDLA